MKRQLLYLGELNDSQQAQWCSALDVLRQHVLRVRRARSRRAAQVRGTAGTKWRQTAERRPEERANSVNRSDCVQVVIALIVTPEGFPVAYEVMPGNTSKKTTLPGFLRKIEVQYG